MYTAERWGNAGKGMLKRFLLSEKACKPACGGDFALN
jgi:hypothetical protein